MIPDLFLCQALPSAFAVPPAAFKPNQQAFSDGRSVTKSLWSRETSDSAYLDRIARQVKEILAEVSGKDVEKIRDDSTIAELLPKLDSLDIVELAIAIEEKVFNGEATINLGYDSKFNRIMADKNSSVIELIRFVQAL